MHVKKNDIVVIISGKERGERGKVLRVLKAHSKVVVERAVTPQTVADNKLRGYPYANSVHELRVPADGQTGVYRLDIDVPTGRARCAWGIESPDLRKVAVRMAEFNSFGGDVYFSVPKGVRSFRLRVAQRRRNAYGQPVLFAPGDKEYARLDGMKAGWVAVKPAAADTGGLWRLSHSHLGAIAIHGVPPFIYSDPSEFFLPVAGLP